MLSKILKELKGSDAFYDVVDAIVVVSLTEERNTCIEELERLDRKKSLSAFETEDYDALSKDLTALNRILANRCVME